MYLPSILQLTELLLFLEELRDIWEWLACECEGLESVECRVLALPLPTPAPPILPVVMVLLWAAVPGVAPPPLLISAVVVVVFWNAAIGLGVTVTMGCTLPAFMPCHYIQQFQRSVVRSFGVIGSRNERNDASATVEDGDDVVTHVVVRIDIHTDTTTTAIGQTRIHWNDDGNDTRYTMTMLLRC